jgi:hypothetical protein
VIIVLAPGDDRVIEAAKAQSQNFPEIYGRTYVAQRDAIPMLDENEDLFFSGHGIARGNSGNAEIGDEDGAFALDGLELWDNFKGIFPDMYQGNVYVDACEAADFAAGMFSLIETFRSQSSVELGDVSVFGRAGGAGFDVPPPDDASWIEAR